MDRTGPAGRHYYDLEHAGTFVVDGLVTSRRPDDLPVFCSRILELFSRAGTAATP
jgi:hypothetical protein